MQNTESAAAPASEPTRRAFGLAATCSIAAGSALGCVVAGWLLGGNDLERARLATRYTARLAWLWFLAAYLARPVHVLARRAVTLAWQTRRRTFGLAFASAMGVHLASVCVYLAQGGRWPRPISRAYLLLATTLLLAMIVTSRLDVQKRLGSSWRSLHRAGLHVIWLAFAGGFFFAVEKHDLAAGPFLALALGSAGIRALAALR